MIERARTSQVPKLDPARLDAAFRALEAVAAACGRCPANEEIGHGIVRALAAAGRIEVEIYARNFRRVRLLTGRHAGAATQGPPGGTWRPYAITDHNGTRCTVSAQCVRRMPSAPRLLTAQELRCTRAAAPAM